ncbi:MAG: PD40 domain-containing protein [Bacteroidaceae bacterium]|nr:PD40 domain-containing protein [Bacteroidaceae bacterium]
MKKNPWLGLLSYDEEKIGEGYKFCGRSLATQELFSLIDNNIFVTMYGKSGIGKSSLLQAGLFPTLRDNDYFPVYIRLGNSDVTVSSYSEIIVETIKAEISRAGFHIKASENLLPEKNVVPTDDDYLWRYFVSNEFCDAAGRVVFPVVVIDQFEELFFLNRQHLATLLRQVYLLIDDSSLSSGSIGGSYVTNFRFLFSIREDDFFRLEDAIEHQRLVEMKYNRYRLTELSDSEAAEVVLQPAGTLFAANEEDAIVERIIGKAKGDSGEINSAILSLLCSRLYDYTVSKGGGPVTLQSLNAFMQGSGGNFLASFFDDVIARLKDRTKWEYIEDALVTDDGRRNSVQKSLFDANVPDCEFLFKGEMAILRCVTYSAGTVRHVEMIHDLLATHLKASRNERRQKAEMLKMRRRQRRNAGVIAIALLIAAFFAYQFVAISKKNEEISKKNTEIIQGRENLLITQSKYIASEAQKEYDKGNITKALRMALYALPRDLENPDRPYVYDAETILRKCAHPYDLDVYNRSCLKHDNNVNFAIFSPNGKYVLTLSNDHRLIASDYKISRIWDVMTGKPVTGPIKHKEYVNSAVFSPNGKYCATASNTACIWDAITGRPMIDPIEHGNEVNSAVFSPCGKYIVTASDDNTARVWDTKSGEPVTEPLKHEDNVLSAQFSPCGKYIVTASRDNTARVWDAKSGEPVTEPLKHEDDVCSAVFNPNGEYIVTASNTACIWDAITGRPMIDPIEHGNEVNSAVFSPCGKYIVTASGDNTARVWDAATGKPVTEPLKHEHFVNSAVFSPCGKYVVTASGDNTARIWDALSGKLVTEPLKHEKWVNSAVFSPCSKYVVTASGDNTARIWHIQSDQTLTDSINYNIFDTSAVYSPDGKYIVTTSTDCSAIVRDLQTGFPVSKPMVHNLFLTSAVFSPDGKYVLTASYDKTARIWYAETGLPVTEPLEHEARVETAVFSSDGRYVITEHGEFVIRIYPFPPLQELIDKYRKDPEHDWSLSEEEKAEYNLE